MPTDPRDPEDKSQVRPIRDLTGDLDEAADILADLGAGPRALPDPLKEAAARWSDRRAFDALSRVGLSINATLEFPVLVRRILEIAVQLLEADRGIIFLGGDCGTDLVPIAARSVDGLELRELGRISRTILKRALSGETIATVDAVSDPNLQYIPSVQLAEIRSILCMPLVTRGEVLGAIYVDSWPSRRVFAEQARRFLEAFAGFAAVFLENARLRGELLRENQALRRGEEPVDHFGQIVTVSPIMRAVLRQAELIALSDAPVMLLGESGTGKELLARAIHQASPRAPHPLMVYNCAAIPNDLMESLFFGHVRGAFTGAVRENPGLFRQADRGVLFLDEVADLQPGLQGKLLRILQDGVVRPLGGDREYEVDVRLITATSRDIEEAVKAGRYREDLFFRTNVLELRVPPLRERTEDIPALLESFMKKHSKGRIPASFTAGAVEFMQSQAWRGNVRALENLVQRALVFGSGSPIDVDAVRNLLSRLEEGPAEARAGQSKPVAAEPGDLRLRVREKEMIMEALHRAKGNITLAAATLGVHRNSLLRRMKRLGITGNE